MELSVVNEQVHLQEWVQMIRLCNSRPEGQTVKDWCKENGITKDCYYYRLSRVKKACLDSIPQEDMKEIVPVNIRQFSDYHEPVHDLGEGESLRIAVGEISIHVTGQTTTPLLERVLHAVVAENRRVQNA